MMHLVRSEKIKILKEIIRSAWSSLGDRIHDVETRDLSKLIACNICLTVLPEIPRDAAEAGLVTLGFEVLNWLHFIRIPLNQEPSADAWAADAEAPEPSPQSLPSSTSSGSLQAGVCAMHTERFLNFNSNRLASAPRFFRQTTRRPS